MTFDFFIKNNNGPMLFLGAEQTNHHVVLSYYGISIWRVFVGFVFSHRWVA